MLAVRTHENEKGLRDDLRRGLGTVDSNKCVLAERSPVADASTAKDANDFADVSPTNLLVVLVLVIDFAVVLSLTWDKVYIELVLPSSGVMGPDSVTPHCRRCRRRRTGWEHQCALIVS